MRWKPVVLVVCLLVPAQAWGWNERGHLAIARLAWLKLGECQRQQCTDILRTHPHYAEFLAADKPEGIALDEWVFIRASYWPDWVRSNHSDDFNRPTWHYVSVAYVPPYSKLNPADMPRQEPNVVTQIAANAALLRSGAAAERPIALCWLLHLIGDIHQPLHCGSLLTEEFPTGDQGGNLSIVRLMGGEPLRLHFAWDALLGAESDLPSILGTVTQLQELESTDSQFAACQAADATTAADWAAEGLALVRTRVYLDGALRPCHADRQADVSLIPNLSDEYVSAATATARVRAIQAARRTASTLAASLNR